ncbi:hypothetical protein [Flavihumibacter sp. CACIAM 22H1]|uniref:hypothetical protein n=1 Tax=Flavihumibacter sp. CACIAM 22H1 TaxID=1812911 RepID=UPI000B33B0D6|nr:hypothetical protein [Flavihumibacter sp. CACIAM 22H1]
MRFFQQTLLAGCFLISTAGFAQNNDSLIIAAIVKEANEHSELETIAHQLTDGIGPRLVGTPQMKKAADWAIAKYKEWGIQARIENWGEWRGWERGITHIDLVSPRVKSLEGMQLAWSPSTKGKTVTGETIILADQPDSLSFQKWLPAVKGKFVLISRTNPLAGQIITGRNGPPPLLLRK